MAAPWETSTTTATAEVAPWESKAPASEAGGAGATKAPWETEASTGTAPWEAKPKERGGLEAKVTKVLDGDTVEVTLPTGQTRHVRLKEIDAPENEWKGDYKRSQKGGEEARAALAKRAMGKDVTLKDLDGDPYGRILASVNVDGRNVGKDMLDAKEVGPYGAKRSFWEKLKGEDLTPAEWKEEQRSKDDASKGITWEQIKDKPLQSLIVAPVVGAASLVASAPEFLTALGTTAIASPILQSTDKGYEVGQKVGHFLFGGLSKLPADIAGSMGADDIVNHAADPMNWGTEWLVKKQVEAGLPEGAARFITDLGMVVAGEGVARGKIGGKTLGDHMTTPSAEDISKQRSRMDERSAKLKEYDDRVKAGEKAPAPLIEAAIRNKETGEIEKMGPKHDEARKEVTKSTHEQGFVDSDGNFIERKDAVKRAEETGQIKKGTTLEYPDEGLHSGDLRDAGNPEFQKKLDDQAIKPFDIRDIKEDIEFFEDKTNKDMKSKDESYKKIRDTITEHLEDDLLNKTLKELNLPTPKLKFQPYDPFKDPTRYKDWAEGIKDAIGLSLRKYVSEALQAKFDSYTLKQLQPDPVERSKVFEAIQRHETENLVGKNKEMADFYKARMEEMGKKAFDAEVIRGMIQDYATRIIDLSKHNEAEKGVIMSTLYREASKLQQTSRFGKTRSVSDWDAFQQALHNSNLKLRTTDLAEVFNIYSASMNKAIINKQIITKLKNFKIKSEFVKDPTGLLIDLKSDDIVPEGYRKLTGTGMYENYAVHPDLFYAMKHLVAFDNPSMLMNAASVITGAVKRLNVGWSFFHGSSLTVANLLANMPKDAVFNIKDIAKNYKDGMLYDKETGRLKPEAKAWVEQGGLMFGTSEDVGQGAIGSIGRFADTTMNRIFDTDFHTAEKITKQGDKLQHVLDHATWDLLHDGLKFLTAQKYLEKARLDHPEVPDSVHMQEIGRAVNNIYGGLDWFEIARTSNKKVENMLMSATSPAGRRLAQVITFSPDWTLSTIKAFTDAIPRNLLRPASWDISKGVGGMLKPLTTGDYARRYQFMYAMYGLTLANGLNIALSGHPVWENKDPTTIDMGDGTTLAWAKHPSESLHWMHEPVKTFYNKMGFLPKTAVDSFKDVAAGKSYEEQLKRVGTSVVPFSIQALIDPKQGITQAISGFAGLPIRGKESGEGVDDRWTRAKNNLARSLGINLTDGTEEENE